MRVVLLDRGELAEARAVLDAACVHDRAGAVADEKLFREAPSGPAQAWGVHQGGALVGVAATSGAHVRLIAVTPAARHRGIGSALLTHAEAVLRAAGVARARMIAQPGNFLAPGLDERDAATRGWLERRGWLASSHRNVNLLVDCRGNPRVGPGPADAARVRVEAAGYALRRARPDEASALGAAVAAEFGGSWPFEIARALEARPQPGVHVAERGDELAGFAVHDGNNQGLGWFGPAGTWPAHRGRGVGEALLHACLLDVAADHAVCEVAWIGPRAFYERAVGVAGERRFVPLSKEL